MKKKKLKQRLENAYESISASYREVTECLLEIDRLKLEIKNNNTFTCPWCVNENGMTISFGTASQLRMHEQECAGNRNKWAPSSHVVALNRIGTVLEIDGGIPPRDVSTDEICFAIKSLQHAARPICVACGVSTKDTAAMRQHLRDVHRTIF